MLFEVAQGGKLPQIRDVLLIFSSLRPSRCFLLVIKHTLHSYAFWSQQWRYSQVDTHNHA